MMTLPNAVSLSRLLLAGWFVAAQSATMEGVIIVIAAITDFLDGWLARRLGQRSRAGEILDPVTDKLFVLTVLMTLLLRSRLRVLHVLLLLARDLYTTAAVIYANLRNMPLRFKSRFSGKVVTSLQMLTVLTAVVKPQWFLWMLGVTLAASLFSMYDYTAAGLRQLRGARTFERPV
jgi:CDP-diacylglycerol--glycerol-3-phosphate 3-phosphatidyltransferase/cardiolipin synthase